MNREAGMKTLIAAVALAALAGCGLETASTAATGAAIKKQELDQGKKSMQQAQEKINQAVQIQQQRAADGAEKQ
jgi:hypothetical protein